MTGKEMRPIWLDEDLKTVKVIDQRRLPHELIIADLNNLDDIIMAIKEMYVRGAPLIGAAAAYGVYLICLDTQNLDKSDEYLNYECTRLKNARPTAVNLVWAVDRMLSKILQVKKESRIITARTEAENIVEFEAENCRKIGEYGLSLISEISEKKEGKTVNLLTHCNAGWLACIEWGTATAPMYAAHRAGIDIHVWVDETRPLNQGARLTAWELGKAGIKHTVITDNAGGHLMQHHMVDMVITGTDRTTYTGDVANKIGTYLKALAAKDNNIPFYVALPSTTFDWTLRDGIKQIPIEVRDPDEISYIQGKVDGKIKSVLITPEDSPAGNYAFDVTPARLITGFITERGICRASEDDIKNLFPEKSL
ncbi:Methylthioribose-1-phosphate isomerase [Desulfonema limicola]|uniref:Methylthioribose-1-phosphate isomerase n=1 Tax=Desulfonema limicola TaxID=45656 RepID=A0A975B3B4_9BACT|nr:S-methyl-5-thioribose-1-phosphate isomerase [Desulfonema limicola]QTA78020.1 Methylthioribose-1-phosphate isomerase [Desulfonema limicola]